MSNYKTMIEWKPNKITQKFTHQYIPCIVKYQFMSPKQFFLVQFEDACFSNWPPPPYPLLESFILL